MGFNSAFKGLNAELNPICHLLALLGNHPILHISRMRFKEYFNTLNAQLNPICHLLALLGAHRSLHVSSIRVNSAFKELAEIGTRICQLCAISARDSGTIASNFLLGLANCTTQEEQRASTEGRHTVYIRREVKVKVKQFRYRPGVAQRVPAS